MGKVLKGKIEMFISPVTVHRRHNGPAEDCEHLRPGSAMLKVVARRPPDAHLHPRESHTEIVYLAQGKR